MRKFLLALFTPSAWDIGAWLSASYPFLASVGAVVAGYFQDIPIMWIIVGAVLTFAGTTFGIYSLYLYNFQRDPEHKLKFLNPIVTRDGSLVSIGFVLRNDALFPIEFEVCEIRTSCAQRIPQEMGQWVKRKILVDPGETRFFWDNGIDIANVTDTLMLGQMRVFLCYGRQGKMRHQISRDLNLYIPLDPGLPFQQSDKLVA